MSTRKRETLSSLKGKADKWFSIYIRLRDSDSNGYCRCITCGKAENWKYMDAGHFVQRQHLGTRYDEQNVNSQCKGCNNKNWNQGEQYRHGIAIDQKYGRGVAEYLDEVPRSGNKITRSEYMELIDKYRQKAREEAEKKGQTI